MLGDLGGLSVTQQYASNLDVQPKSVSKLDMTATGAQH